jgi:hypothetical protein
VAKLHEDREAYSVIRDSIVSELVEEKGYSGVVATKLVSDIIKERKKVA